MRRAASRCSSPRQSGRPDVTVETRAGLLKAQVDSADSRRHRHGSAAFRVGGHSARRAVRGHARASSCRSGRSTLRSCIRPPSSTSAIRTRSSGSTTSRPTISAASAAAREPSAVSRARQHLAGAGHLAQRADAAHLGARRRPDQGLRHGGLRRGGGCGAKGTHRPQVTVTLPGGNLLIDWNERTTS